MRILLLSFLLIIIAVAPAMAQDPGIADTVAIVASVIPDATTGQDQLQFDLYVYNDELISGHSMGFSWDYPGMTLDSAVASSALAAYQIGPFFYENNDIAISNANDRFINGGAALFGGIAPATSRTLWTSYYFTVTNWAACDSVKFDTLRFNAGSTYLLSSPGASIQPVFTGAIVAKDTATCAAPANLVVDPMVLNYVSEEGGPNPAPQIININSDSDPLAFTLTNDSAWLTYIPSSSTTPQPAQVAVNSTGKPAGSYVDTITVTSAAAANTPQKIVVNLTVTARPRVLTVTPDTILFTAEEGGANPANQNFTVSEIGGDAIAFNLAEGSAWMSLDKAAGTTPESVGVLVDITGLAPGDYGDSVAVISAVTADTIYAHVTLTVTQRPRILAVTPDTLYFTAEEDGAMPASQMFIVTETGGDAIAFTSVETIAWLSLDKMAGTTPDSIVVTADMTGLAPGTYTDSIVVASAVASNGPQWVIVNFAVTPRPRVLVVVPDSLIFTATVGGSNPASQALKVSEIGGDNIAFTATETNAAISLDKTAGNTPDSVVVSVDIAGLAVGTIIDSVEFGSVVASNSPIYRRVIINLNPAANQPVVLDSIGPKMVNEGEQLLFLVHATDPDGTIPQLSAHSLPTGATFEDSLNGTGIFVWWPTHDQAGTYFDATFRASDGEFLDSELVEIIVYDVNRPPVADAVNDTTIDECMVMNKFFFGSDPDSQLISWGAEGLTPNMIFEDSDGVGVFLFAPDTTSAGTYPVTIYVTDGIDTTRFTYTVTVEDCIIPNNPPVLEAYNDTTIGDCYGLTKWFFATDADGDVLSWNLLSAPAGFVFEDSATYGKLSLPPDIISAGMYPINMSVSDGIDTVLFTYNVTVTPCDTTPCVDIILSDTAFAFVDTIGIGSGMYTDTLSISSSGADIAVRMGFGLVDDWIMPVYDTIMTPGTLPVKVNTAGLSAGSYSTTLWIEALDTMDVCDPFRAYFTVNLTVVDTAIVGGGDELSIATVPAVPGAQVVVPVTFTNGCDLTGISAILNWNDTLLTLDSITFEESRVAGFSLKTVTVDNLSLRGGALALMDTLGTPVAPGNGNFVNMYFSVAPETPPGFYEIVAEPISEIETVYFIEDCYTNSWVIPDIITGGIMVDTAANYVCGYVVDPDGHPIPGATVELWDDFAGGMTIMSTTANGSGAFAFSDFNTVPFDLWAHMDGYYPGLVENLNFGDNGIMIVLTPVSPVVATWEWVNFYCGSNTYFGSPLPVGSVVDAYDPDGVHCGTWYVSEAGSYGFMPVYRDDPYTTEDEGADPNDAILFFVNGKPVQANGNVIWTDFFDDAHQVCLEAGQITHSCDLFTGWNLISWPVDTDSDAITDALASISDCIEVVLGFEQGGLTYDPTLPQFSTLSEVDHLSGYWVKSSCNVTLEITGAPVSASTPIPVATGWNLVSYLPDFSMAPMAALSSIHADLVVALGYDSVGLTYQPGQELFNTLTSMSQCYGYWVKVNNDGDLIYPGVGPLVVPQRPTELGTPIAATIPDITPTRNWMNLYANELQLNGEVVKAGAVVTAHTSEGMKIGSFTMNADGLFGFMPVYADDKATSEIDGVVDGESFYLSINGVETAEAFTFTEHGGRVEIFNLTAKTETDPTLPTSFSLSQNYPNPFNPTTTISFSLPADGQAKVEVFNILGRLVATPFDGIATAGENQVVWDGLSSGGESVASGIYFYRLSADNYSETRKMTLLK